MAKILFCEDDAVLRKLISISMRHSEHEVYIAADGMEGLAIIEHERPDFIFTDIKMPRCDGFQLAIIIKKRPHLAHIPIIFMTGFSDQTIIEEVYRHHGADYLIKPIDLDSVLARIKAFVDIDKHDQ